MNRDRTYLKTANKFTVPLRLVALDRECFIFSVVLEIYFQSVDIVKTVNKFTAPLRILCFQLFHKPNHSESENHQ